MKTTTYSNLGKLGSVLSKDEKKNIFILTLGSIVLSLSEVFSIGVIIPIMTLFVDREKLFASPFLQHIYRLSGAKDVNSFLVILIFCAFLILTFKSIFTIFMIFTQQKIVGKIYVRLTSDVLQSYLKKPYAFHLMNNSSLLFKNVSTEVGQFTSGFLTPVISIGSEIIILFGIFVFLTITYPILTLALIAIFGIVLTGITFLFKKRVKSYSVDREYHGGQMYKTAIEALNAVKEIIVFRAQHFFTDRYVFSTKKYIDAFVKFMTLSSMPRYLLESVLILSMLVIILVSMLMRTSYSELIPMMTVLAIASLRLLPSISKMYNSYNLYQYSTNSLNIITNIIQEGHLSQPAQPVLNLIPQPDGFVSTIGLRNLTFCYESASEPILEDFTISINLGSTTAIVGPTGSGKSTIIDLLMGLLLPAQGGLYFRGKLICPEEIIEYRNKIGYVPQNIFLVDDTICSNIAFGVASDKINYSQVERALKIAQLESFVGDLPLGLRTMVGERGGRISGGQKQRIGIARALYSNPEILIFDEATSALDLHTETQLYDALKALNKTLVIITHRLSTIEKADAIYVIGSGKISHYGSYQALLGKSEIFQKITREKISHAA